MTGVRSNTIEMVIRNTTWQNSFNSFVRMKKKVMKFLRIFICNITYDLIRWLIKCYEKILHLIKYSMFFEMKKKSKWHWHRNEIQLCESSTVREKHTLWCSKFDLISADMIRKREQDSEILHDNRQLWVTLLITNQAMDGENRSWLINEINRRHVGRRVIIMMCFSKTYPYFIECTSWSRRIG